MYGISEAAHRIGNARYLIAFTGAGISVESGVPSFRGKNGIWDRYDPQILDLDYFVRNPEKCWSVIREIFYDFMGTARPNKAHLVLVRMEQAGLLKAVITQNIDHLHQEAGSHEVYEFHGNSKQFRCLKCGRVYSLNEVNLEQLPPVCVEDGEVLKPDFVFFGEGIPTEAYQKSVDAARSADVCLIIGSTGEVVPAAYIPEIARQNGAYIIEINPDDSVFTRNITQLHLKGKAGEVMTLLEKELFSVSEQHG